MMLKNQRLTLALALALGSSQVLALGLGTIDVRTKLNEPLVAEIPLLGQGADGKDVKVRLASPEAFARIGIDRPAILAANLQFAIQRDKAGKPVIRVTTPSTVREPYLNFLLEVEWGRGRLMREYTVLLDPPVMAPAKAAAPAPRPPVQAAPARPATPVAAPPQPAPTLATPPPMAPTPARPSTPSPAAAAPTTPAPAAMPARTATAAAGDYGPVKQGETLWSIAQRHRPGSQVSMNQMMVAMLAANPDAFVDGNINRLKRGAVLRIPTAEQLAAISQQAAAAQVIEQTREWQAGRGGTPQPAAPASRPSTTTASSSRPTESRLELVPPKGDTPAAAAQSGAAQAGGGAELRADLARTREQVASLQQENTDLKSRVVDLEKLDTQSKALIRLKDSELAAAQARLAELERKLAQAETASAAAAPAEPVATPATATDPATTLPDQAATAADATATSATEEPASSEAVVDVSDVLDDMGLPPADDAAADTTATAPAAAEPVAAEPAADAGTEPVAEAPPAAEAEAWYRNPMILGGGLGVLVLGGILAMVGRGKKAAPKKPAAKPTGRKSSVADDYAASGAAAAAATAAAAAAAAPAADRAQTLVDAIAEQPDNLGRHLALVRHYYEASDASGFEGAAEAMYAQLFDPEDPSWKQVLAMGRELLPDHPLFAAPVADTVVESSAATEFEPESADFGGYLAEAEAPQQALPEAVTTTGRQQIDWNAPAPAFDADTTASYNINEIEELAAATRAPAAAEADLGALDSVDFSYDAGLESTPAETVDGSTAADYGAGDAGMDGDDAASTKLELARAYLDMGDVEGARGMLEEVVGEGNPGQRAEAKRLLDEIR